MPVARSKTDDYTCRTARRRLADGGSIPPSSTIYPRPTLIGWPFFLRVPRVLARVHGVILRTQPLSSDRLRPSRPLCSVFFAQCPWRTPGTCTCSIKDLAAPVAVGNCPAAATERDRQAAKRPPEGGGDVMTGSVRASRPAPGSARPSHRATGAPAVARRGVRGWRRGAPPTRGPAGSAA